MALIGYQAEGHKFEEQIAEIRPPTERTLMEVSPGIFELLKSLQCLIGERRKERFYFPDFWERSTFVSSVISALVRRAQWYRKKNTTGSDLCLPVIEQHRSDQD
jgi:hypothetical protein